MWSQSRNNMKGRGGGSACCWSVDDGPRGGKRKDGATGVFCFSKIGDETIKRCQKADRQTGRL